MFRTVGTAPGPGAPGGRIGRGLISLALGAALWEWMGRALDYRFLPPLSRVVEAARRLVSSGEILGYLASSLTSLAIGYCLAAGAGVGLGLLLGRYRTVDRVLEPYLSAFLATPKLVFVPIVYAFLGIGRSVQVAVVVMNSLAIIAVNTRSGVRVARAAHVEMARSFGATERQLFRTVLLPGALPMTLAGLRLGMGRAVSGMVRGEMYISLFGLGALLRKYGGRFDSERVFAILLFVIGIAVVLMSAVGYVERRLTAWTEPGR